MHIKVVLLKYWNTRFWEEIERLRDTNVNKPFSTVYEIYSQVHYQKVQLPMGDQITSISKSNCNFRRDDHV